MHLAQCFVPNKDRKLLELLFVIDFPPEHPSAVPEMVELGMLEGTSLPLLFKGTCLKTMKLWNPF